MVKRDAVIVCPLADLHTCPLDTGMKRLWTLTAATIALLGMLFIPPAPERPHPGKRDPDQRSRRRFVCIEIWNRVNRH